MAARLILDTQVQQDSAREGVAYWNLFENHFDEEKELHKVQQDRAQSAVALDHLSLDILNGHGQMHGWKMR